MSQLARRVTAAVLLAAILGLAAPAFAALPSLPSSPRPSPFQGSDLMHRMLTWIEALWPGAVGESQERERKLLPVSTPPDSDADKPKPVDLERGGMIDPNG